MKYTYFYSDRFEKQFRKLDPYQRRLVEKKTYKIIENPKLGKPLHAPLQKHFSERIEKLRIIYKISGKQIEFAWIDDRGHVYG